MVKLKPTANPDRPQSTERLAMHLLFSPELANVYYIGGGSLGLILLIVVVVLLLR
jgi:hypothetical protein